jgi:hypothetical protein
MVVTGEAADSSVFQRREKTLGAVATKRCNSSPVIPACTISMTRGL